MLRYYLYVLSMLPFPIPYVLGSENNTIHLKAFMGSTSFWDLKTIIPLNDLHHISLMQNDAPCKLGAGKLVPHASFAAEQLIKAVCFVEIGTILYFTDSGFGELRYDSMLKEFMEITSLMPIKPDGIQNKTAVVQKVGLGQIEACIKNMQQYMKNSTLLFYTEHNQLKVAYSSAKIPTELVCDFGDEPKEYELVVKGDKFDIKRIFISTIEKGNTWSTLVSLILLIVLSLIGIKEFLKNVKAFIALKEDIKENGMIEMEKIIKPELKII